MENDARARAMEAVQLLDEFIYDLITGTRAHEKFETASFTAGATEAVLHGYHKMADSLLILTLAKWIEFYQYYHKVIPATHHETCKQLHKELLRTRGVKDYRNQVVGHFWHRKEQRPMFADEMENLAQRITGGDRRAFLTWINDPANNHCGVTVVGTSVAVRDAIKHTWAL